MVKTGWCYKELLLKLNSYWRNCFRSSRPEVFCKKFVLRNFTRSTGKQLYHNLFFNKVAGLSTATSLKKRPWHKCFPVNFAEFLRNFLTEQWLLPVIVTDIVIGGLNIFKGHFIFYFMWFYSDQGCSWSELIYF